MRNTNLQYLAVILVLLFVSLRNIAQVGGTCLQKSCVMEHVIGTCCCCTATAQPVMKIILSLRSLTLATIHAFEELHASLLVLFVDVFVSIVRLLGLLFGSGVYDFVVLGSYWLEASYRQLITPLLLLMQKRLKVVSVDADFVKPLRKVSLIISPNIPESMFYTQSRHTSFQVSFVQLESVNSEMLSEESSRQLIVLFSSSTETSRSAYPDKSIRLQVNLQKRQQILSNVFEAIWMYSRIGVEFDLMILLRNSVAFDQRLFLVSKVLLQLISVELSHYIHNNMSVSMVSRTVARLLSGFRDDCRQLVKRALSQSQGEISQLWVPYLGECTDPLKVSTVVCIGCNRNLCRIRGSPTDQIYNCHDRDAFPQDMKCTHHHFLSVNSTGY